MYEISFYSFPFRRRKIRVRVVNAQSVSSHLFVHYHDYLFVSYILLIDYMLGFCYAISMLSKFRPTTAKENIITNLIFFFALGDYKCPRR